MSTNFTTGANFPTEASTQGVVACLPGERREAPGGAPLRALIQPFFEGTRNLQVIYDDSCALCRSLAAFGRERSSQKITFISWSEFRQGSAAEKFRDLPETPESLMLWDGLQLQAGPDAWEMLLRHHPDLKSLGWLAARIGLTRGVAASLNLSSSLLRRFCPGCGIYMPSSRTEKRS